MGKDLQLTPTMKRVAVWVAAVIGLALLIFGVSAISSTKRPADSTATTTQLSAEARADVLARRALAAASENDTGTARSLAESALKLSATNQTALGVIDRLDAADRASRPATTAPPSATPTTTAIAPDAWTKPVKNLATLLPTAVAGWTAGSVVVEGSDALVTFEPVQDTADAGSSVRVTFNVHDRGTPAKATAFVSSVDKKVYPGDGSSLKIGTSNGYFGTDGARLAVAAFARGRYAFEVVVYSQQGIKPATLRSTVLKLASSLPAAR